MAKATQLTKREQIAGLAMVGLLIAGNHATMDDLAKEAPSASHPTATGLAHVAYAVADAMIAVGGEA